MREIKFKAWNQSTKTMIDLQLVTPLALDPNLKIKGLFIPFDEQIPIMQYTGLKDAKGKEIYEGDIVIIEDTLKDRILDDGSGPTEPANHLAPVVFQDGSFGVYIKEHGDCFDKGFWSFIGIQDNIGMTLFEVIGNIYENPELLEVK